MTQHILITEAAGSGTTTFANGLAKVLGMTQLQADDYFWLPSEPPYQHRASREERCQSLLTEVGFTTGAVVAGSIMDWDCPPGQFVLRSVRATLSSVTAMPRRISAAPASLSVDKRSPARK